MRVRIEAQHQAGDLGRADVENGEPPALDRGVEPRAHRAVHLDAGEIHVRLPGSPPAASRSCMPSSASGVMRSVGRSPEAHVDDREVAVEQLLAVVQRHDARERRLGALLRQHDRQPAVEREVPAALADADEGAKPRLELGHGAEKRQRLGHGAGRALAHDDGQRSGGRRAGRPGRSRRPRGRRARARRPRRARAPRALRSSTAMRRMPSGPSLTLALRTGPSAAILACTAATSSVQRRGAGRQGDGAGRSPATSSSRCAGDVEAAHGELGAGGERGDDRPRAGRSSQSATAGLMAMRPARRARQITGTAWRRAPEPDLLPDAREPVGELGRAGALRSAARERWKRAEAPRERRWKRRASPVARPAASAPARRVLHQPPAEILEGDADMARLLGSERGRGHAGLGVGLEQERARRGRASRPSGNRSG